MGTASRLAVILDQTMLEKTVTVTPISTLIQGGYLHLSIAPANTQQGQLGEKTGREVAAELAGRYLLRYLLPTQVGKFTQGTHDPTYLTPTPLAPEETVPWLNLPSSQNPRPFVLLIDPARIPDGYPVLGPRWVYLGGGIEYFLPSGFPRDSVVDVGGSPNTKWELPVT